MHGLLDNALSAVTPLCGGEHANQLLDYQDLTFLQHLKQKSSKPSGPLERPASFIHRELDDMHSHVTRDRWMKVAKLLVVTPVTLTSIPSSVRWPTRVG